jgi:hypothetical protein
VLEVEVVMRSRQTRRALAVAGVALVLATGAAVAGAIAGGGPSLSVATEPALQTISSRACGAGGVANLAVTTPSRASVFVGVASEGANCLVFEDANGTTVGTSAQVGATPAGRAIALKALDTSTGRYHIVIAVPDGYDTVRNGDMAVAISNNVAVIEEEEASPTLDILGSAGKTSIDLTEFLN